ncbi:MFS transporter [Candidatus Saccharibacteria bacterium]|nr:MFS transporter [Candidatus Saccharibacteria bacterium]
MSKKLPLKNRLCRPFYGLVFGAILSVLANLGIVALPHTSTPVYAAPESMNATPANTAPGNTTPATTTNTADTGGAAETNTESGDSSSESTDTCYDQVGAIGWLICPSTGVLGKAIDAVYEQIEKLLVVSPVTTDGNSPIYKVWEIMRDVTNIVFVILLLVVVYSQVTGLGISNYGIKKALPKLVVAAVLVNMSYLICALAVDVSNIIGANLKGVFTSIEESAIAAGGLGDAAKITWTQLTGVLIGGGAIAGVSIGVAGGLGALLWPLIVSLIGGILSVLVGLITIGMRQALISVLIMISPLAFVAYMLPNTESWFKKWKDIFTSMLIFYPMFSLLFGTAQLAGWAIIANSLTNSNFFGVVLGMAVQVFPLILSVSLMKMSGTVLGRVSSKLDALTTKPRGALKDYGKLRGDLARNRYISESIRPSAGLRRYMDARQRRQEIDLENVTKSRKSIAEIRAQKMIMGGSYRPEQGNDQEDIKANRSTRSAKNALNLALEEQYTQKDSAHLLDQYGDIYKGERDQELASKAGHNYLEFTRAMLAEENDAYADQDWLMSQYDGFRKAYDPAANVKSDAKARKAAYNYNHYVVGAAGALGKAGEHTVLGEVISKSSANEAKRKAYTHYVFAKYGYNKGEARNMIVGYNVDDDGFAVNKDGSTFYHTYTDDNGVQHKVAERSPGEFLKYHPDWLKPIAYNKTDSKGNVYYDAVDQKGQFIGRVYKNDGAAMKEIFSEWDMPINDPINGLYGILSGVYEGDYAKYGLKNVGLAQFSTTLNRATLKANFKEKAAFAGPMYATSVGQRYIKDMVHLNIARLDNLTKTAKPSGFNTQDAAELNQLKMLMDPANWDWMLFDEASLRSFKNVNGKPMKGTRYITDVDGSVHTESVAPDQATFDELRNTVINKYLLPAAPKFASMMSRMTNGIIDNQKPGAQENWGGLLDAMEKWNDPEWQKKYPMLKNPFAKQVNDTIARARQVRHRIAPSDDSLNKPSPELRKRMADSEQKANSGIDGSNTPKINKTGNKRQKFERSEHYTLTEEDKRVDREYEQDEQNSGLTVDNNSPDYADDNYIQRDLDSSNHIIKIDQMVIESNGIPEYFFEEAREYLDNAVMDDPRFSNVIEQFEEFVSFNGQDATLTVEDFARELKDLITCYTYEE